MTAVNRADALRREVSQRNADAILDATVSELDRDPKASLVDIAKAAGVSRPTLYAHFPTREDLVEAAVRRALDQIRRDLAAIELDSGDATAALERLIATGWHRLARNLGLARLALDSLPAERLRRAHAAAFEPMRDLVDRGRSTGEFRDDQPVEWMVSVLYALLHAAADDVASGRIDERSAAQLVLSSSLAALSPSPSPGRQGRRTRSRVRPR
jgi:TetR/AcrR family transcriptional regulator, mexCD-oprJ operon repressor